MLCPSLFQDTVSLMKTSLCHMLEHCELCVWWAKGKFPLDLIGLMVVHVYSYLIKCVRQKRVRQNNLKFFSNIFYFDLVFIVSTSKTFTCTSFLYLCWTTVLYSLFNSCNFSLHQYLLMMILNIGRH
jgi:hypothetical protein